MNNIISESDSDLKILAADVLKYFGIRPEAISVLQGGNIKTVWKVRTKDSVLCLKRLKQSYEKALFSVNAQIYVQEKGGNVPAIYRDTKGQSIVTHNGQLFVLYEWINGSNIDMNNKADLQQALHGLAKFHIASKGYKPVEGARISSKLEKWPEQYASMREKFIKWKVIAQNQPSISYYQAFLKYVDFMIGISEDALKQLERTDYLKQVSEDSDVVVLCHQDFGKGNAFFTDKEVYVIDLDGVTFDLPARDLRKIIGKNAENKGAWDLSSIKMIIEAYESVNELSAKEKEVLYTDLMFPHWFYGLVKNIFLNGKAVKPSEIEKVSRLEQSKMPLLNMLIKRGEYIETGIDLH